MLAVALSAIGAWTVPALAANAELVEGWALTGGAICVITLIVWMMKAGKTMKSEIEAGLDRSTESGSRTGVAILLFVTVMIAREGFETVLFMTAISFNTDGLERMIGAIAGLAISIVFGIVFIRGTMRVDLARFFRVTTVVLMILAVQLIIGAYHEFAEAGVLPANRLSMSIVGPIVRYDSILFAIAVLLTLLLMSRKPPQAKVEHTNAAEKRKFESGVRRERMVRNLTVVTVAVVSMILLTGFISQAKVPELILGDPITLRGGQAHLPIGALAESGPTYFYTEIDNRNVRYFAMKRPQGDWVVCLDACLICGDMGYYPEAGGVTCRNCTAPINSASLGQSGGCNPVPLPSELQGGEIIVRETDLQAGARHFLPNS